MDDIKQGKIGNCYLLAGLASLVADDPNLIYQLFRIRSKNQEFFEYKNYFEDVLFIDGVWQFVIIEDLFISYNQSEK